MAAKLRLVILMYALLASLRLSASAAVPKTYTLATNDVRIELKAGESAPALISLSATGGLAQANQAIETLPTQVDADGQSVPVSWKLVPELTKANEHAVEFVYDSAKPHLRVFWRWEARAGFGPVEHQISVRNLGETEVWLPLIDSLALELPVDPQLQLSHFSVEKGADSPSAEGTHLASLGEGFHWIGRSSTYAHPTSGQGREIIPIEMVFTSNEPRSGWFAGIEFSGRVRIALDRAENKLHSQLGLDPEPGPYRTRLVPGGEFVTPKVFLGTFKGGLDGAGNQLRPWVRAVLNNPITWQDPQYPLTVNNSWGSGMQVDEALALRMLRDSKELGLEMFHIDAGWFRGVGDWYPDETKFPHGLAPIADEAHRQGLRFGVWVDWTQAALDTGAGALNIRDPKVANWLAADPSPEWKPEEFKGQTIDIGVPAAHDYAASEVKRIVSDYHLDMLEHDGYLVTEGCTRNNHPHAAPVQSTLKASRDSGFDFQLGSNSTDVSYHAVRAYYDIQDQLHKAHPGLLLEVCNDGGRMVDFGSAAHGDYFSITDTYDPLSNRRAFYDTSHVLPAAMLEAYVEKWPVPKIENFRYMLRSGMMGWLTIMLDTTSWTAEQHDEARKAFALYKVKLRPLIRDAQLFHVSDRPDGVHWDGVQYWDPASKRGAVYAFRGTTENEPEHRFKLSGLDAKTQYKVHFEDKSAPDVVLSGMKLMNEGLEVKLPSPLSSELIFLDESAPK